MSALVLAELLDADVVRAIAADVWTALFDEEALDAGPAPLAADALSARVDVLGPWTGSVVVTCSAGTATDLTRRLHRARPLPQLDVEDVEDALGELANVLGGNVKALLPGPSSLGLPVVGPVVGPVGPAGSADAAEPADLADTCRVDVLWRDRPVTITVRGAVPDDRPNTDAPRTTDDAPEADENEVPL